MQESHRLLEIVFALNILVHTLALLKNLRLPTYKRLFSELGVDVTPESIFKIKHKMEGESHYRFLLALFCSRFSPQILIHTVSSCDLTYMPHANNSTAQ